MADLILFSFQSLFHTVKITNTYKRNNQDENNSVAPLPNELNGVIKPKCARKIQVKWKYNDVKPRRRIQDLLINMKGKLSLY